MQLAARQWALSISTADPAVANPHPAGFSALVAADIFNLSDLRPLNNAALALLPLLTLCWLRLTQDPERRQPEPLPLEHPPQLLAAV